MFLVSQLFLFPHFVYIYIYIYISLDHSNQTNSQRDFNIAKKVQGNTYVCMWVAFGESMLQRMANLMSFQERELSIVCMCICGRSLL